MTGGEVREADVDEVLRASGRRVTRARQEVWRALTSSEGHPTVEELAGAVRRAAPGVNLASVYRSLALFAELGVARETRIAGDDAARWEVAHPDEHFHVVCDSCGAVDHHVGDVVDQVRRHLDDAHDFVAHTVELTVSGRCGRCRELAEPPPSQ